MSDLILNIRFGIRHLQITRWPWKLYIITNDYWKHHSGKWFAVYTIGNWHYNE